MAVLQGNPRDRQDIGAGGPLASQALGDMGADGIKVEAPQGDQARQIGPVRPEGMGPVVLNANRNKRSVILDLMKPAGRAGGAAAPAGRR